MRKINTVTSAPGKFPDRKTIILPFLITALIFSLPSCFMFPPAEPEEKPLLFLTNPDGEGITMDIEFRKGRSHYFPLMAIWIEDTLGNFIQTLYVAESIATGIFAHGDASDGKWMPGPIRRPAALPFWGHRRGIRADDGYYLPDAGNPVPDAYTGATPGGSFILTTRTDNLLKEPFYLFFEINQSWDWNKYWTNNKYPDDMEYFSSAQPAIVYNTLIDPSLTGEKFIMEPVGRSHHSGATGELFVDLHTLTTALEIAGSIEVRITGE
jgi:hypothetical protein